MASLTMDNPLSPSPQVQIKKVVQDLLDCIEEIARDFEDVGYPITDDSPTLHRFCAKLEHVLQFGFKGKTSLFGEKKDYWNYFCDCIGSTKDLRDGIKFVKSNTELRTSLGRGRAFLRFALVHQRLADTLQQCVCSSKQTNDWYHPRSVWLQPAISSTIINALYDLNNIQFDLLPRGYDLDTTWPTFARKTFGSPQSWAPPSRSISISSLSSSIPALEIPPSPSLHSIPKEKDTEQIDQLQEELNESENEKFSLQLRVESLSENKRMSSERVEELEKKVEEIQKNCNDFEKRCEILTKEMQIKDSVWLEKEQSYKAQVESAEQTLGDIKTQLTQTGASKDALAQAELVTKLAIQKKESSALRIELKAAQLELQCKSQTDAGKTKVIELLDKKIEQLQSQNSRMLTQIEKVSEDRMRDAEGNRSSQHLIEATMDRLKRADAINAELQKANESLRTMLHSMEEKSQKISNLAKEKMTLYKAENTKLQLDIQVLMKEVAKLKASSGEKPNEAKGESKEGESPQAVDDAVLQALDNAKKDADIWKTKYEEATTELEELRLMKFEAEKNVTEDKTNVGDAPSKLLQLEQEKKEMKITLDKSREEVKKILVEKMKVDEEAKMVEVRQKEARARHEELLKALALKETEARRLELELDEFKTVVEASETGQEGAEDSSKGDKPLVSKLKKILKERSQIILQYQSTDVQNISLRKDLETAQKKSEEMTQEIITAQLQIADLKTAVSKAEVASVNMAAKLEEYETQALEHKKQISKQDLERQELISKLEQKEEEIKALKIEIEENTERIRENVQNAESDQTEGEIKSVELSRELEKMKEKEVRSTEQNRSLTSKVDEFKQRYEDLMEQKVKIESKLNESENKLKTTKQTLKKVDKENKKLLVDRDNLRKERETLESDMKALDEANTALKAQITDLEQSITNIVEEKLVILQGELKVEQDGRRNLESEISALRVKHSENDKIVEQLQEKRMSSAKEHQEEMRIKQEEIDQWREKCDEQKKRHKTLLKGNKELQHGMQQEQDKLKMDLDLARCNYEKVQYQLEGEMLVVKETEDMIIEQLGLAGAAEGEAGLKSLAASLIGELEIVQSVMSSKDLELKTALKSIESHAKSIKDLELASESYEKEKMSKNRDIIEKDAEIGMLQMKVKETESKKQSIEHEFSEFKQNQDTLNNAWQREKENFEEQIKIVESKALEKDAVVQACREDLTDASKKLENFESEQLQKQGDRDHMYTEKLSSLEGKLKEKQMEISLLQKTLEEQRTKFQGIQQGLQQEVSSLKFELSTQEMEHQEAVQGRAANISDLVSKLNSQESLIDMLEKELETLKRERLLEKNRTLNELEELRQSIRGRDEECKLLNSELKRTSMLLDEERNVALKLKNEMVEIKSEYEHQLRLSRQEVELLREDTNVLKQQLIKIIKDKDILWQKTDKLEYLQKLTLSGSWMEDTDTKQCLSCNSDFSFMLRKHHCRLCGRIFCYNCCSQWIQSPHSSKKIRICNDCAQFHHMELDRAREENRDHPSDSSILEDGGSSFSKSVTTSGEQDDDQEEHVTKTSDKGEQEEGPPSSFHVDDDLLEETNLPGLPEELNNSKTGLDGSLLPDGCAPPPNAEISRSKEVDKEKQETGETSQSVPEGKNLRDHSDNEVDSENYDVITEEEVAQSVHESVYEIDSQHLSSPMVTVEQIASGLVQRDPDLWIKAGKIYTVPVFIDSPGIVLCWEFSTEPKGIHFSVTFRKDALTSNDLSEVLIPLCPCNSHRQAVQGELIAVQPGLYTLVFDNSTSRFTSKKLTFQLNVKKPEAAD